MINLLLMKKELNRLKADYEKCDNLLIKKQIKSDIKLLIKALDLLEK